MTFTPTDTTNYLTASIVRSLTVVANTAPTISDVTDRSVTAGGSTGPIAVTISDAESAASTLVLSATSSNPSLVPQANIQLGGTGSSRTATVTAAAGHTGTATITLVVSDGQLTATDTFVLTVLPGNGPTIDAVASRSLSAGTNTGPITVTLADATTGPGALTLTGASSDTTLIPNGNIMFGGSGANRTVTITPAPHQTGTATVTLTTSDGTLTAISTIVVIVYSSASGATLYGVGDLPGGAALSDVRDVTRAGGVLRAVGGASANAGSTAVDTAVLWTSSDGMTAIPNLVTNPSATNAVFASAITPDGAYIASRSRAASSGGLRQAVRVTTAGLANLNLGNLGGFTNFSAANAISANGQILYGFGTNAGGATQALRFTAVGPGATSIPFLNAGDNSSSPAGRAASADGSSMIGTSTNTNVDGGDFYGAGNAAYRFTMAGGVTAIPKLPGGSWNISLALAPSGNLALLVGESASAPNGEAYLQNFLSGAQSSLGTPNGGWRANNLGGMSGDGSVVALGWFSNVGTQGMAGLRNAHGWHDLQQIAARAGVDLTGWTLGNITGMSADATLVWGNGTHNGHAEGWVLDFPAGYLAAADEPVPFSTPGSGIVGAWTFGDTSGENSGVVVFFPDGYYMQIKDCTASAAADGECDGFERGQYTWNAQTGAFSCRTLLDTNGTAGLSGLVGVNGATLTVSGGAITANIPGEAPTVLNRVAGASPIVGAFGRASMGENSVVAVFLPNGVYFIAQDGDSSPAGDPNGKDGMERGTYTWNEATGVFATTTLTDTNGEWGFSDNAGQMVITFSPDQMTLLLNGSAAATRVPTDLAIIAQPTSRAA
ncbi:MAG TPA: hypothetical protein VFJ90_09155, partial [Candidatus Didemnitutus sp.]|nr:hypothetical protein [Candidatus Didemnitutus sp.]